MKKILLLLLALGCLAISPRPTRACFCIQPELSESFKRARAIFFGEATEIVGPKTSDQKAPYADRAFTIRFKILESWKGLSLGAAEFNILWLEDCYECHAHPNVGEKYLVYADPVSDSDGRSIVTWCDRTTIVDRDPKPGLTNAKGVEIYRDMKQLDIITKRAFRIVGHPFRPRT
jgi:hypothetical protein